MFPKYKDIQLPLLTEIFVRGGSIQPSVKDDNGENIYEKLAAKFELTKEDLQQKIIEDGKERSEWENRVRWVRAHLKELGFIDKPKNGIWRITEEGKKHLFENINKDEFDKLNKSDTNDNFSNGRISADEFEMILLEQAEIGELGEIAVLEYEKEYLIKRGKKLLADKVKRVSLIDVSAGYDILSYDVNGNEKYIEVKSTSTNQEDFIITKNEVDTSRKLKSKYFIYRITKLNDQEAELVIIKDFYKKIGHEYRLEPTQFRVLSSDHY